MTQIRNLTRALCVVGAALAVAAPAASAEPFDRSLYDMELPAGVVEHGVAELTTTGSPQPMHIRTEYWASNERWRSVEHNVKTGKLVRETFSTKHETTIFNASGRNPQGGGIGKSGPHVLRFEGRDVPPLPGWAPGYNRKLVQRGLLSPVEPITIAGLTGTLYLVPDSRKTSDPDAGEDQWLTDNPAAKVEIALEDGTFAPLVSQYTTDNGKWGTFVQREELISRERVAGASGLKARLSQAAKRRAVNAWRAKVRASKKRPGR